MAVGTGILVGTALATAGANVAGAALGARGSKKAADTQVAASERAAGELRNWYQQESGRWPQQQATLERLQNPFIQPGQQAAATLGRLLTPGMAFGPSAAPYLKPGQTPETYDTNPFMGAFDRAGERPGAGRPPAAPPTAPYGTAGQQVQDAYQMYLGRTPSAAEVGSHLGGGSAIAPQNVQFALNNIRTSPEAMAYGGQQTPPPAPPGPYQPPPQYYGGPRGIPRFARGGMVTRPTLAMIGEAGPEAIVPLTAPAQHPMASALQQGMGLGSGVSPSEGPFNYEAAQNALNAKYGARPPVWSGAGGGGFGAPGLTQMPQRPIPFNPGPSGLGNAPMMNRPMGQMGQAGPARPEMMPDPRARLGAMGPPPPGGAYGQDPRMFQGAVGAGPQQGGGAWPGPQASPFVNPWEGSGNRFGTVV